MLTSVSTSPLPPPVRDVPSRPGRWTSSRAVRVGVLAVAGVALSAATPGPASDAETTGAGLGLGAAVLLGLVEGLTEWLPISSTGHLTVTQRLLGIDGSAADSYAIAIQAGAILAVLLLYRRRFQRMYDGLRGRDEAGRRTLLSVVVACLPAVVVGLTFEDVIKDRLFGPWPVVVAWFVGGVAILVVARRRRGTDPRAGHALEWLGPRTALVIGLAQVLALWPGVSRSLTTILAATALGLAVPAAVEFSFLLGFVVLGGATGYEVLTSGTEMVDAYGVLAPVVGLLVAFASAVVAMRWMVGYLNRHGLEVFGWYRIGIAGVVAALLVGGIL